jgi:hypothetical protein
VYALATSSGLHVFQAFSAALTFNLAFSWSNGGLISVGLLPKHLFKRDFRYIILYYCITFEGKFYILNEKYKAYNGNKNSNFILYSIDLLLPL